MTIYQVISLYHDSGRCRAVLFDTFEADALPQNVSHYALNFDIYVEHFANRDAAQAFINEVK